MKNVLNIKNRVAAVLAMFLCAVLCLGVIATGSGLSASAEGEFTNEAPNFNDITHVSGTYTIAETNGVNVKFEDETSELVYSKEIDITQFNGNQEFIKFYVKPLGDRYISFYVDIIDSANPDNVLSVRINSKDGGSTQDSSITACVPSIGQVYTGYFTGSTSAVRANSVYMGHRKYSNITVSNESNRTAYASVHFGFDNNTNGIYLTYVDNPYTAANKHLVCDLDDTDSVITSYYLHDGTLADKSQVISNKKGLFDEAWEGFEGSNVTVKIRAVSVPLLASYEITKDNPVEIYITKIGGAVVDADQLSLAKVQSKIDVIYSMGGGTNNPDNPDTIGSEDEVALLDATRNGYKFLGWYTSADFAESSRVTVIPTDAGSEVILYARFAKLYDINYNLNGGTNNAENATSAIEGEEIVLKDATKEGYTFNGWYTSSDFSAASKVSSITMGSADVNLYAKFSSNSSGSDGGSGCGSAVDTSGIAIISVLSVACAALFLAIKFRKEA